jgi:hypothetical protein
MILGLLAASDAHVDRLTRLPGESAEAFAKRVTPPGSQLIHQVIETSVWSGNERSIIAFFELTVPIIREDSAIAVTGTIFFPAGQGTYRQTRIGDIEEEGGRPEVRSVFFANADKDPAKELIVIVSWPQKHYDVYGDLYGTLVYDNPDIGNPPEQLKLLEKVSARLDGGCDCRWRDGKVRKAKYKTAGDIRSALRKMGYK